MPDRPTTTDPAGAAAILRDIADRLDPTPVPRVLRGLLSLTHGPNGAKAFLSGYRAATAGSARALRYRAAILDPQEETP